MSLETVVLSQIDPLAQEALRTGWLGSDRLIARAVLEGSADKYKHEIVFERVDRNISRPKSLRLWLVTFRAFSLTATITPCVAVGLLLFSERSLIDLPVGIFALLGVAAFQVAINVWNDVEDYRRLIDLPDTAGGSGVIQSGWWTPLELTAIARWAMILGVLFGAPALFLHPQGIAPVGFLGSLGVLLYSAKRFGLKYHSLGDVAVLILCGPLLTVGFSLAVSGSWDSGVLWLGGFFGFLAASLLHVNNLQDMNLDRKREVRTLALVLGFKPSLRLLIAFQFLAPLCLVGGVVRGALPSLALVGVLVQLSMALPWLKKIMPASGPESALLTLCRVQAAKIHLCGGVGLCFGLFIARYLNN